MQTIRITFITLNIAYALYKLAQSDHSAFYSCLNKVCNNLMD